MHKQEQATAGRRIICCDSHIHVYRFMIDSSSHIFVLLVMLRWTSFRNIISEITQCWCIDIGKEDVPEVRLEKNVLEHYIRQRKHIGSFVHCYLNRPWCEVIFEEHVIVLQSHSRCSFANNFTVSTRSNIPVISLRNTLKFCCRWNAISQLHVRSKVQLCAPRPFAERPLRSAEAVYGCDIVAE